ncbi:MAG: ABC transporter substrate-binding protein [Spirochaetaceae bacterium]|nr:MAG: ABC transporter substrate-binding protein [Spirochaetaceae bacterium]
MTEIKIGVIAMLSGDSAQSGRNMVDAARLAVEEACGLQGIRLGRQRAVVSLIVEDDRSSPEGAMNAARKLIYQDDVVALIGPQFSRNAIPVARLAEDEGVLMICPMSTHPDTTAGKTLVFRIPYLDTFQGQVLARFARHELHCDTASVLYDIAGVYNCTLAEVFKNTFEETGGKVTAYESYTTDDNQDFSKQLACIAEAMPGVLLLPNYASDVLLQVQQARAAGITAILLGGDGWDTGRFTTEPAFDGSFSCRHWHPEIANTEAKHFIASFQHSYKRLPGDVAATTYDAVRLLLTAIEKGQSRDPEVIRDQLYDLESFSGVTGTIRYDGVGDPTKSAVIVQIKDGRESFVTLVEP